MSERVDEEYLRWVRGQACIAPSTTPCARGIQAHHIHGRGTGGGSRDDRCVVPLCDHHHNGVFHSKGRALPPWDAEQTEALMVLEAFRHLLRYEDETGRLVAPLETF